METLPEPQDWGQDLFRLLVTPSTRDEGEENQVEEDVARYSDLSYALGSISGGDLCWQAVASIGARAFWLATSPKTDAEKLVVPALEPMEATYRSLTREAGRRRLTDDEARILFFVRFGLGSLLLLMGDLERAKVFFHEMAATRLSRTRKGARAGEGIVAYMPGMDAARAFVSLLVSPRYLAPEECEEWLRFMAQAADTPERLFADMALTRASSFLDRWAARCERTERREGADEMDAFLEWTALLYSAAEVVSVCQYADTLGAAPGDCETNSAQFFAYKFGQLAARFAASNAGLWHDFFDEVEEEPGTFDFLVEALLSPLEGRPDWHKLRDRYESGWRRTPCYAGMPAEEIGPHMDLYWAMRIGFADKMLESAQALVPAGAPGPSPDPARDIQTIKDVVTTVAIRQVKQQRDLDEQRPPTEQELRLFLEGRLAEVWDNLPSDVTDALISAEYGHRDGWRSAIPTLAVLKGFHEAVAACLAWYFARPFATYLAGAGVSRTAVEWGVWNGQPQRRQFHAEDPRCLSLGQWAGAFRAIEKNPRVAAFLRHNWPGLGTEALRELAALLRKVQDYRNRAEHPRSSPRSHHTEKAELDEMRKLVLGLGDSPSVIVQIYGLLAQSKQS